MPFALPGIVGHEGGGIVESVGAGVTEVVPGDKTNLGRLVLGVDQNRGCLRPCRALLEAFSNSWSGMQSTSRERESQ